MDPFLNLLDQAAGIVEQAFPGSKFYEADGQATSGVASDGSAIDGWRFVFLGPLQQNRTTSVMLEYAAGTFGPPTLQSEPFLGDQVIELPLKLGLARAIQLKNNAGFTAPFATVTLRWPLTPESTEPAYIFGSPGTPFVFVGTVTGTVTQVTSAKTVAAPARAQPTATGEQIRLSAASGLVYKAYRRPYMGGGAYVLSLFASGYHDSALWELFFMEVSVTPVKFKLMEKVPKRTFFLYNYYVASVCSNYGLPQLGNTVTIRDAYGDHEIAVEDFGH
jgi:hypothetical protein